MGYYRKYIPCRSKEVATAIGDAGDCDQYVYARDQYLHESDQDVHESE